MNILSVGLIKKILNLAEAITKILFSVEIWFEGKQLPA
jgi:hypothetical protein